MDWQLLHPDALWFLLLGPLIILLHLIRRRPKSLAVPFLPIWEKAEPRRAGGFRRLGDALPLLLSLIILALLTLALARPYRPPPLPEHVLIVLDDSASMGAVDRDGVPRIDKARERLLQAVRASPGHVRFALVRLAGGPRLEVPFHEKRNRVLDTLRHGEARPLSADAAQGVRAASALVAPRTGPAIWLASDTPPAGIPDRVAGNVPVHPLPVGDRKDNARIADFTGAWGGWWDEEASFFLQVENEGPERFAGTVKVTDGETALFERDLDLDAGASFEASFGARRRAEDRMLTATVSPGGALALDDRAWCGVPGVVKRRVCLISRKPSAYLRSALQGLEEMVDREGSVQIEPGGFERALRDADLAVFEGAGPGERFPAGGCLVFGAPSGTLPPPGPASQEAKAAVKDWDRKHPVTRGLSFDSVFFSRFRPLPPAYRPLVTTDGGAVIGAREGPGGRAVVVSASLANTNLGLVSAFPIFVRNAVRWVGGSEPGGSCPQLRLGCGNAVEGYEVRWLAGFPGGPGVAELSRKGERRRREVNFFDEAESTLFAPAEEDAGFPIPEEKPPEADPWPWLVGAALVALLLSWALLLRGARAACPP